MDTDPHPTARFRPRPPALVVADAMLTIPKTFGRGLTVAQARQAFSDDHVHALLVVNDGVLLSVLECSDLHPGLPDDEPAARLGSLAGRIVDPQADLEQTRSWMLVRQRRRLAVVDIDLHLLGLLCMKRSNRGFCSDADICSRASDRAATAVDLGEEACQAAASTAALTPAHASNSAIRAVSAVRISAAE